MWHLSLATFRIGSLLQLLSPRESRSLPCLPVPKLRQDLFQTFCVDQRPLPPPSSPLIPRHVVHTRLQSLHSFLPIDRVIHGRSLSVVRPEWLNVSVNGPALRWFPREREPFHRERGEFSLIQIVPSSIHCKMRQHHLLHHPEYLILCFFGQMIQNL
jgi:hypothetical protein